jgi:adenosylmethionine-8-amino-7-oxononanoate aminotransferase
VRAEGANIWDSNGRRYLDAAGGAIVVGIGHGDQEVVSRMAAQASQLAYVHGSKFTTDAVETYAAALAPILPLDDPRVYLVSGGSEAIETAFKLARSVQLARGETSRIKIVARRSSYHGNSLAALDASSRPSLRRPYEPWLGRTLHASTPYEYRCELDAHPSGCGRTHATLLEELILREGPETIACFVAEPIGGATLAAAVPPADYWPSVADVCRRHGILIIADEVMTGFGRTGTWFACDHWGLRPDILVAGKGASSGYWPLGLVACSKPLFDVVEPAGFVNGFTFSHSAVGAAVGLAILERLQERKLVQASATRGAQLRKRLREAIGDHPSVGDIRGRGLLVGIELVRDQATKLPFSRRLTVAERVSDAAQEEGLLVYTGIGMADGADGDAILLGPPLTVSEDEVVEIAERVRRAVEQVLAPEARAGFLAL